MSGSNEDCDSDAQMESEHEGDHRPAISAPAATVPPTMALGAATVVPPAAAGASPAAGWSSMNKRKAADSKSLGLGLDVQRSKVDLSGTRPGATAGRDYRLFLDVPHEKTVTKGVDTNPLANGTVILPNFSMLSPKIHSIFLVKSRTVSRMLQQMWQGLRGFKRKWFSRLWGPPHSCHFACMAHCEATSGSEVHVPKTSVAKEPKISQPTLIAAFAQAGTPMPVKQDPLALQQAQRYLREPNLPIRNRNYIDPIQTSDEPKYLNPLDWWRKREPLYPKLAKLARIMLAIPATSAPSERIFGMASICINKFRKKLDPSNASMIMFLQANIDWFESLEVVED